MGWELRHGNRWYLYRCRRVNGKPVKEYLAAQHDRLVPGFGAVMADQLGRLQRRLRHLRGLARQARSDVRGRIDDVLTLARDANAELRVASDGLLAALGYHKHRRGEWRMKRDVALLKDAIRALETQHAAGPGPLVNYTAPEADAEAAEVFAKSRAGDAGAQARLRVLIRDRNWTNWIGDLGVQATHQLVHMAAAGDVVWMAGIAEKVSALIDELLGEKPTVLEVLLARRVINGWLATHALELELAVRPPAVPRDRAHLDAALSRAQKRLTEAVRELARVRKLQAPVILAQLNVAASQTVVNGGGSGAPAKV
ncbi:hypothetical protein [Gemmata sp.]|uniref:hypothetical protein n=1 Tax=Gemmata sp. TaxID=1914242 RepID=UPI003F7247CD